MAEITFHHREALSAYGLAKDKLSKELQTEFGDVEKKISAYLKNPVDDKLKDGAEHASALLGHKIMDFVEKAFPEAKKVEKPAEQKPVEQKTETSAQPTNTGSATPPVETKAETVAPAATVEPPKTEVKKGETTTQQTAAPAVEQKAEGGNVEAPKKEEKKEEKKSGGVLDFLGF